MPFPHNDSAINRIGVCTGGELDTKVHGFLELCTEQDYEYGQCYWGSLPPLKVSTPTLKFLATEGESKIV